MVFFPFFSFAEVQATLRLSAVQVVSTTRVESKRSNLLSRAGSITAIVDVSTLSVQVLDAFYQFLIFHCFNNTIARPFVNSGEAFSVFRNESTFVVTTNKLRRICLSSKKRTTVHRFKRTFRRRIHIRSVKNRLYPF